MGQSCFILLPKEDHKIQHKISSAHPEYSSLRKDCATKMLSWFGEAGRGSEKGIPFDLGRRLVQQGKEKYTAFLLGQKHFNYQLRGQQSHKTFQLSHSIRPKAATKQGSISHGAKHCELTQVQRERETRPFPQEVQTQLEGAMGYRSPFVALAEINLPGSVGMVKLPPADLGKGSSGLPKILILLQKGKPTISCVHLK